MHQRVMLARSEGPKRQAVPARPGVPVATTGRLFVQIQAKRLRCRQKILGDLLREWF